MAITFGSLRHTPSGRKRKPLPKAKKRVTEWKPYEAPKSYRRETPDYPSCDDKSHNTRLVEKPKLDNEKNIINILEQTPILRDQQNRDKNFDIKSFIRQDDFSLNIKKWISSINFRSSCRMALAQGLSGSQLTNAKYALRKFKKGQK